MANPERPNEGVLNPDEIETVSSLLSKLRPGLLPLDIYHEISRLTVRPVLETVPLRKDQTGRLQVLLLRRSADDPFWPNQLHLPGKVILPTDSGENFEGIFSRLKEEMPNSHFASDIVVFGSTFRASPRGLEVVLMSWIEVSNDSPGDFYHIDQLPPEFIQEQIPHLLRAIDHFNDSNKQ